MINRIRVFFKCIQTEGITSTTALSIEVATAVLLFEVMKADREFAASEKEVVSNLLQEQFLLSKNEIHEILMLAEDESFHANDFYKYTNLINNHFSLEQRIVIVESLWKVAYADGHLDVIEEHIIRKIADLLHLRHEEFIQCKLKIQKQIQNDK